MKRMMPAPGHRSRLARGAGLLVVLGALSGCGSQTIRFDRGVTTTVADLGPSQLQQFGVYYQDNYSNGPTPSAVLLDADDGVAFAGERWSRAQSGSAPRLLSQALDAGYLATELRDTDGNLLGYLVATERWYDRRRNRYRLVVAEAGGSYEVLTSEITHEIGGGR
ncbi:MAG: hypothetical protein GWN84_09650 [Gammaproteobacteria bacterium]|nr:hypothetical protein [Gammaproteobacteria bacterium]NIR83128.1 hypothetical protein [Gammaproteobacteria bacterium]NIR90936.1 hypothetical protein [Gammaproteobacteria bacterium]NIU04293.1 hypothetical protein [Gammaproteobacteria bacterium]NIV52516.1 hypothetical protein [Gammaproteobacteria bacterium]